MKPLLVLILMMSGFVWAAEKKLNDLSIEQVAQGTCGTLASAMTERVYNTNKEMKKEHYKTPVFDSKTDFEMMKNLKALAADSETFTAATPDSRRMSSMLASLAELKRRNYRYVRVCLGVYRPVAKGCFSRYQQNTKADLDTCMRESVDKLEEAELVKEFFLSEKKA